MNWQERAEKAEAELARLREQEPVAYVKYKATGGNVGLSWLAVPTGEFYPREGEPFYAAPVPAVAAPAVPEEWLFLSVSHLNAHPRSHLSEIIKFAEEHGVAGSYQLWKRYRDWETDRKSTRLNSSHSAKSRMPSSA